MTSQEYLKNFSSALLVGGVQRDEIIREIAFHVEASGTQQPEKDFDTPGMLATRLNRQHLGRLHTLQQAYGIVLTIGALQVVLTVLMTLFPYLFSFNRSFELIMPGMGSINFILSIVQIAAAIVLSRFLIRLHGKGRVLMKLVGLVWLSSLAAQTVPNVMSFFTYSPDVSLTSILWNALYTSMWTSVISVGVLLFVGLCVAYFTTPPKLIAMRSLERLPHTLDRALFAIVSFILSFVIYFYLGSTLFMLVPDRILYTSYFTFPAAYTGMQFALTGILMCIFLYSSRVHFPGLHFWKGIKRESV